MQSVLKASQEKQVDLPSFTKPEYEENLPFIQDIKAYFVPTLLSVVLQGMLFCFFLQFFFNIFTTTIIPAFGKHAAQLGTVCLIQFSQLIKQVMCAGTPFRVPSVYDLERFAKEQEAEAEAAKPKPQQSQQQQPQATPAAQGVSMNDIELVEKKSATPSAQQQPLKHLFVLKKYLHKSQATVQQAAAAAVPEVPQIVVNAAPQQQQQNEKQQQEEKLDHNMPRTVIEPSVKTEMLNVIRFCCFNIRDAACIEALYAIYLRALHDQNPQAMLFAQAILHQL